MIPLAFIKKRTFYRILLSLLSVLIALSFGALVAGLLGANVPLALYSLFIGAVSTSYSLESTFNLAAVLLLTGIAAALAFTGGIWNFGMEGQLYIGALAAMVPIFVLPIFGLITVPMALIFGGLGGGIYAAIAGVLKVKFRVTEIVSTMLLNFIALLVIDYATQSIPPLHSSTSPGANTTPTIPLAYQINPIAGGPVGVGFFVAVAMSILVLILIKKTRFGFELRVMGGNLDAANYVGIPASRNVLLTIFMSGCMAGLAGCILVLSTSFALFNGISNFYGWLGVPIALLALLNPIAIIFSSFFFSLLNTGSIVMRATAGVPVELALMIEALVVIVVLVRPWLERKVLSDAT